jgi:hypothetical protein
MVQPGPPSSLAGFWEATETADAPIANGDNLFNPRIELSAHHHF